LCIQQQLLFWVRETTAKSHSDFSLCGANLSRALIERKERRVVELGSSLVRFLAAKIEFSYGAGQTVNLLALRLQWFESTPTQVSPKAILQVFKPFGGQLCIHLSERFQPISTI
jgi:hypothetical protein